MLVPRAVFPQPEPDPSPTAVLRDELQAGALETARHHVEGRSLRCRLLVLKIPNRDDADLRLAGEVVLGPFEQASGGAALSRRHADTVPTAVGKRKEFRKRG